MDISELDLDIEECPLRKRVTELASQSSFSIKYPDREVVRVDVKDFSELPGPGEKKVFIVNDVGEAEGHWMDKDGKIIRLHDDFGYDRYVD